MFAESFFQVDLYPGNGVGKAFLFDRNRQGGNQPCPAGARQFVEDGEQNLNPCDSSRFPDFLHVGMNASVFIRIGKTDATHAFFQEGMDRAIFLDNFHIFRKQAGGKIEDFTAAFRFDGRIAHGVANVDMGNALSDQGQIPLRKFPDGMPDIFPSRSGCHQDELVLIVIMEGILKMGKCHDRKGSVDIVNDFPPQDFHESGMHTGFDSMIQ